MNQVIMKTDVVELYRILKFEGLASSGGEAKYFVSEGLVKVNGVVETQKRKKIVAGDIVEFNDEKLEMVTKSESDS